MKVFISYSLNDADLFVIPTLVRHLNEQGMEAVTSYTSDANSPVWNFNAMGATLFIALITQTGKQNDKVVREWSNALQQKLPSIALVEDTPFFRSDFSHYPNAVFFNRHNPSPAIQQIKSNRNQSASTSSGGGTNALAWILGGVAAIALIKLLSDDD